MDLPLKDYFARTGWAGGTRADGATLHGIVTRHVFTFPFENLDVFLSGRVSLDPGELFDKFVRRRRGGWCFEMNGLLAHVLSAVGFRVRTLMARNVWAADRPRSHQVLLVALGGNHWLVDSGFGGQTLRHPFPFADGHEETQEGQAFRLERRPGDDMTLEPGAWFLRIKHEGQWKDLYRLTLETFQPIDFLMANHFHVSAPVSSFTRQRLVSMPGMEGRQSLVDRVYKRFACTPSGEVLEESMELANARDFQALLADNFGLEIEAEEARVLFELETPPRLTESGFFAPVEKA